MRLATAIDSGEQVEDAIQRIEEDVQGTERGQRQLAALRFYLQEVLWQASDNWAAAAFGLTNYEQLVDDIERWRSVTDERVVYVTFNYDLLLERALRRVVDTTTFAGYVSGKTWLLKAHGSVNWGRSFAQPSNTQNGDHRIRLIDRAPEHVPTASGWGFFRGFDLSQPGDRASISATWMYPALAMPTRTKGGFVMPPEHEGFIARAVQDMDRLMVIGWRGQEQHFLDLLKASPRPVQGVVVTSKPEIRGQPRGAPGPPYPRPVCRGAWDGPTPQTPMGSTPLHRYRSPVARRTYADAITFRSPGSSRPARPRRGDQRRRLAWTETEPVEPALQRLACCCRSAIAVPLRVLPLPSDRVPSPVVLTRETIQPLAGGLRLAQRERLNQLAVLGPCPVTTRGSLRCGPARVLRKISAGPHRGLHSASLWAVIPVRGDRSRCIRFCIRFAWTRGDGPDPFTHDGPGPATRKQPFGRNSAYRPLSLAQSRFRAARLAVDHPRSSRARDGPAPWGRGAPLGSIASHSHRSSAPRRPSSEPHR